MTVTKFNSYELLADRPVAFKDISTVLLAPPAWTRLEPQTLSGEPEAGITMRLADPLWMLARQWQMGEFKGEDCGTPVSVRVQARTQPLTALRPGGPDLGQAAVPLSPGAVFEPVVEAEPWAAPCLRDRAEAGAALVAALAPLGWGGEAQLLAECAFDPAAADIAGADPMWQLIARHHPDAEAAALGIEAGTALWLDNEPDPVVAAAKDWLTWYRTNVSARPAADSWHADRLEYRFAVQAGTGAEARSLEAHCHLGGAVDWHSFDLGAAKGLGLDAGTVAARHDIRVHASRLRYAGMPVDRLWQFEDGLVNFGLTDVQPNDLTRLAFLEYATIYGTDWLIAPIDLPRGVLAEVTAVTYRTTFGEDVTVNAASDGAGTGRFCLYRTDGPNGPEPVFVIPPNGRAALEGDAREEVVFARDETANVVWAIERSHEGADGLARDRSNDATPLPDPARPQAGADDAWTLEIRPPDHWVPMVPVPTGGDGGFILRKGSFDGIDRALGRVLAATPFDVQDEEVPREGVRLCRVPSILRDETGQLRRWTARRVTTAWGESRSRLEYDATRGAE